jgi:hypothetical protein
MERSRRKPSIPQVCHRIKSLFHNCDGFPSFSKNKMTLIHSNPNVYLIRDFINVSEINYLDGICTNCRNSFRSSFTENSDNEEVVSEERTSQFVHLHKSEDRIVRGIEQKAADLVGLSPVCVEPLQIVSYRAGEKFNLHHDAGSLDEDGNVEMVYPRRLVTLFVYLNNLPEGEGHTEFPLLNGLSVTPRRGCAVMFCNVLCDGTVDKRTVHQANPVSGSLTKYGLNVWLTDTNLQELVIAAPRVKRRKATKRKRDHHISTYPTGVHGQPTDSSQTNLTAFQHAELATISHISDMSVCRGTVPVVAAHADGDDVVATLPLVVSSHVDTIGCCTTGTPNKDPHKEACADANRSVSTTGITAAVAMPSAPFSSYFTTTNASDDIVDTSQA